MTGKQSCLNPISHISKVLIFVSIIGCATSNSKSEDCVKEEFIVAIDIGHSLKTTGATSARGVKEHTFNKNMATLLLSKFKQDGFVKSFLVDNELELEDRAELANKKKVDLLLSIHHDSVQPIYLSPWIYKGKKQHFSNRYTGFSLFYSEKNSLAEQSLLAAKNIGAEMLKNGLKPTLHHAEKIKGENREIVDDEKGVYRFDDLIILKKSSIPAVLVECGIIVNQEEEKLLSETSYQMKIVEALISAVNNYCRKKKHK